MESLTRRMSDIREYFTTGSKRPQKVDDPWPLLDPTGPLSKEVPSQAIRQADKEVAAMFEKKSEKYGPYRMKSLNRVENKDSKVCKYASIHGTVAAIRLYKMPEIELKESTVRTWKKMYTTELHKASTQNTLEAVEPATLPAKKRGHLFCLERS